jgi:hypothetical protein
MFPFLVSWNEFVGTSIESPLDGSISRAAYKGYTRSNVYRDHIREYSSEMEFTSMGTEIKSPHINDLHSFRIHGQIYHLVLQLYPDEIN